MEGPGRGLPLAVHANAGGGGRGGPLAGLPVGSKKREFEPGIAPWASDPSLPSLGLSVLILSGRITPSGRPGPERGLLRRPALVPAFRTPARHRRGPEVQLGPCSPTRINTRPSRSLHV